MTEPLFLRSEAAADPAQPHADVWRKEVHSRVDRFRTRRGRRIEGAFSMRFPFPPVEPVPSAPQAEIQTQSPEPNVPAVEVESVPEPLSIDVVAPEPQEVLAEFLAAADPPECTQQPVAPEASFDIAPRPEAELEPQPVMQPRARQKHKVIAFPRQAGTSEMVQRLADPILPEQPRILDVPEELEAFPTTPLLDGLQFEPVSRTSAVPSEHIELPFRAVSISQRIYAAVMDGLPVAAATAVFGLIGHKMLPNLAFTKPARLTAAAGAGAALGNLSVPAPGLRGQNRRDASGRNSLDHLQRRPALPAPPPQSRSGPLPVDGFPGHGTALGSGRC